MNEPQTSSAGHTASDPEGAGDFLVDRATQHSCAPLVIARDEGATNGEIDGDFSWVADACEATASQGGHQSQGKDSFINLGDVVSVQANGKHVSFRQASGSYLLRESISGWPKGSKPTDSSVSTDLCS
jgi:hypothetical protein